MEGTTRSPNEPMTLRKEDLPATYQAATRNSVEAQGRFLRRSAVGLIMVVLAAGAGSFVGFIYVPYTTADVMAIGAAAAFCAALVARISLLTSTQIELMADCLAGSWANTIYWEGGVGRKDLKDAMRLLGALKDEYHGTAQQRQYWFMVGYKGGDCTAVAR